MEPEEQDTITPEQRKKISILRKAEAIRSLSQWDGKEGHWFWLSFADTERFLGGAVVFAPSVETATLVAHALKINPGGEAMIVAIPDPSLVFQGKYAHRLLSLEEAKEMDEFLFAEEAAASASSTVN